MRNAKAGNMMAKNEQSKSRIRLPEPTVKEIRFLEDEFNAGDGAREFSITLLASDWYHIISIVKDGGELWDEVDSEERDKLAAKLETLAADAVRPRLLAEKAWLQGYNRGHVNGLVEARNKTA